MTEKFTTADKLACVEREVRMRAKIYPNRILTGRMSAESATREIDCMKEIADDYRQLAAREKLL